MNASSAALTPLGVPTIDLLPVLRSAPHGQYFAGTVHLTATGHTTVAAALEAFIRREHLLDLAAAPTRRPRADAAARPMPRIAGRIPKGRPAVARESAAAD